MNKLIVGIILVLLGLFILVSGFQASSCQINEKCLGMEKWFNLWDFDNAFIVVFFIVIGLILSITGGLFILDHMELIK